MSANRKSLVFPILLIIVGSGWMLSVLGIVPGIDWAWTLTLAGVGLLAFLVGGVDKVTIVVGPFFIITSMLSVLRQSGRLRFDLEVPILVVLTGVLLLVARLPTVPRPAWMIEPEKPGDAKK